MILAVLAPAPGAAQSLGLGRRLDPPRPGAADAEASALPEDDGEEPDRDADGDTDGDWPWAGPQIQLGYTYWKLSDGYGGGDTHAASVEVFLQWPLSELRTGLIGELGGRGYSLGGDDLVARGAIEIGFQLTELVDPVVPYLSLVVSAGAVVGERFDTTVVQGFGGAGLELGAAVRLVRNLHLSASVGYQRLEMDGAAFDVFFLRLGAGL
ncbi:MAG TPA: hypothetical protein RMH99_26045 [Sandaracinaceae bacterium LLY-WYZ-13_1]|nr:hypothetical protein [Sandaracinaceae bacterium LLY-WYZ-13_1]